MVSDQEIAKGVESVLRQSDPNAVVSFNGVVQQVEAKLGLDLSHKAGFIRDQLRLLLGSPPPPPPQPQVHPHPHPKDHFALQHHPQFQSPHPHLPPHFALQHHSQFRTHPSQPQPPPPQLQPQPSPPQPPPPQPNPRPVVQNVGAVTPQTPKESTPTGTKRRGGPGGLNKHCGVSPQLQAIVGEPTMPRTQIVKQLWAYIRKNNLQDPSNKRKIICDDALRLVFETDCTDMFKMNKLLAKHIIPLEPTKASSHSKRPKIDVESAIENTEPSQSPAIISDALAKFFGTGEREMIQSEVIRRVWEYIKFNRLEDPMNSMVIRCDPKLRELLGCESISALGIPEMVVRHLRKRS